MTARPRPRLVSAGPCRLCGAPLTQSVIDLGRLPRAASVSSAKDGPFEGEIGGSLRLLVCGSCTLVQLRDFERPRTTAPARRHAARDGERLMERFGIDASKQVIEVLSGDGSHVATLRDHGIPALGIAPTVDEAIAARGKGVKSVVTTLRPDTARVLARSQKRADLLIANDALTRAPDLNGLVAGLKILLASTGVLMLDVYPVLRLLRETRFDAVQPGRTSYFSLAALDRLLARHGLAAFDAEPLPTDGGWLRVLAGHDAFPRLVTARVVALRKEERDAAPHQSDVYREFARAAEEVRRRVRAFLASAREDGKTVVGYGGPDAGTTLVNYCGIGPESLQYTVCPGRRWHGRFLPGTRVPVAPLERLRETRPDYLLVLAQDLADDVVRRAAFIREWGGRFVIPFPQFRILG